MQSNKIAFLNVCSIFHNSPLLFYFFFLSLKKTFVHDQTLKPANCALLRLPVQFEWGIMKWKGSALNFFLLCTLPYFKCLSHGLICWAGYWITFQSYPHFAHNVLQPGLWNHLTHWGLLGLCQPSSLWNLSHWSEHGGYNGIQHSEN